jgi:hypothetical protein
VESFVSLSNLTQLDFLTVWSCGITEISWITPLVNLSTVYLGSGADLINPVSGNAVVDVSPLMMLTNLRLLAIGDNLVQDLEPLVNNPGLFTGSVIWAERDPLSDEALCSQVPSLEARGVIVHKTGTCPVGECSYYKDLFDQEWDDLKAHLSLGPEPVDVDSDGLPELWALRLVALILCEDRWPYQLVHDEVYGAYVQNLLELEQETPSIQPYKEVLAALLLMGTDLRQEFIARLGLTGSYTVFWQGKTNGKSPNEPFSGAGDIDGDGITNAGEYAAVVSRGGSIDTFAQAALYWPGAERMPVAGIVGLGALASVIALAGARRARRR